MTMVFNYTKTPCAPDRLDAEIRANANITVALANGTTVLGGNQLTITFRSDLPDDGTAIASTSCQTAALDSVVAAHGGVPLASPLPMVSLNVPTDTDGAQIMRPKTTKTGWHFEPRSMDFFTAKFKSLYNRKYDTATVSGGTDLGDGTLIFFDQYSTVLSQNVSGGETDLQFQTRLDTDCVMTYCDWEPRYSFDLVGAYFQIAGPPDVSAPAYLWTIIAPDIPSSYGGSVPFCNGGWNLAFFQDRYTFDVDAKGVKSFTYDPVYHSGKIRTLIKHAPGVKVGVQIIFKQYKA